MVDFNHESDRGRTPMGFMDKAKKLAEQAQEKLDEVQTQFNANQQGGQPGGGPAPEYDQHGRPVGGAADAVPDQKAPTTAVPDPIEGAAPEVPPAAPTGAPRPGGGAPAGGPPRRAHGRHARGGRAARRGTRVGDRAARALRPALPDAGEGRGLQPAGRDARRSARGLAAGRGSLSAVA